MFLLSQCMLFGAAVSVLTDLSSDRIPNVICASLLCTSFALRGAHPSETLSWLGGACTALLLYPFFKCRLIGAGDIKLLMALGSFLTPSGALRLLFLSFLSGAVISVLRLLLLHFRSLRSIPAAASRSFSRRIHFSVPVFAAVLLMTGGDLLCVS